MGGLALPACGGGGETAAPDCRPAGTELRIAAGEPTHKFSTNCLAAPANRPFTIKFTNLDQSSHGQHNVEVEDVFKGKTISGHGDSITYEVSPLEAGTYDFLCTKHPFMQGTLVVE